jgi:hypothetical protein
MASLSYIPRNATLLLLFKAARGRLMASGENPGSLSDARLASAAEEMNRIADDIRQANGARHSDEYDAAFAAGNPAGSESAVSEQVAVTAAVSSAKPKTPHKTLQVDKLAAMDLSAEPDGVQWAGEYNLLASRREKAAFVSLLVRLGYIPDEFRVTVRRVSSSGLADTQQRYSIVVVQTQSGVTDRERRYAGGHDEDWVRDFSRDAAVHFRCSVPFAGSQRPAGDRPIQGSQFRGYEHLGVTLRGHRPTQGLVDRDTPSV